jgi:hypothetical protein
MHINIESSCLENHIHCWGKLCKELLSWRQRDYRKWITSEISVSESKTVMTLKIDMDMDDALGLACLILNGRDEGFVNLMGRLSSIVFLPQKISFFFKI